MEEHETSGEEMDRLLEAALSAGDPEADRRAIAASIRAINRVEALRVGARARARRAAWIRFAALLVGWICAGSVAAVAGRIAEASARAGLDLALASPLLDPIAGWLHVQPFHFAVGLLALVAATAVSIRLALAQD